ncbi:MAG: ABC transporter ATP-binding protein [Deltaproteobacteria bacterium]|nr:ABC transporter ATP-binding protein [Deltaproteobacteria bacterium]
MKESQTPVVEVIGLKTYFRSSSGVARAVDGVSFGIRKGSTFALVGESGCGKSVTALSIIGLIDRHSGWIEGGKVRLGNEELTSLDESTMRQVRGMRVSMIFQEPMTSLNPVICVGEQVAEGIRLHQKASKQDARVITVAMLSRVGFDEPERIYRAYPHTLSGGQRQRVMIAMAVACKPELLIADEPTTALDVTIQEGIVRLIKEMQSETSMAVLLITHNMALVYKNADEVGVMYAGKIVEAGSVKTLFSKPLHPYTIKLLRSMPVAGQRTHALDAIRGSVPDAASYPSGCRFSGRCPREMAGCAQKEPELVLRGQEHGHPVACHLYDAPFMASRSARLVASAEGVPAPLDKTHNERPVLLEVRNLKTWYPIRRGLFKRVVGHVKAVDGISLSIRKGMTLALVGESGCGKSTAGKSIIRLITPDAGEVLYMGKDLCAMKEGELRPLRRRMQMIFQDPYSSLDPRRTIMNTVGEGLEILYPEMSRRSRIAKTASVLERVGLGYDALNRYPHEFSGGQRQRIGIARALAVEPEFIVCDEAVSALDVSVQAQILNLLKSIQLDMGIAMLFITHDLGVVEYMADEVAVMYDGKIVEHGNVEEIFARPRHEYTKKLLAAVPRIDSALIESLKLPVVPAAWP